MNSSIKDIYFVSYNDRGSVGDKSDSEYAQIKNM